MDSEITTGALPRPTLTITLGLNNELCLVKPNGNLVPIREGYAEEIFVKLLRARHSTEPGPCPVPSYIPPEAYAQVKKFTARGRQIVPELSLSDLDL